MTDVLRRKLGATRAPKKAAGITLEALLRKTMPRDADAVLSLDVAVQSFAVSMMDNTSLRQGIGEFDLVYLLESQDGARGLAVLDLSLTTSVVEVQVFGRLSAQEPLERTPTRTDGIVAGEIVDRWLDSGEVAASAAKLDGAWPFSGFARAPVPINRREAELLLEPVEFRVFDIALALGRGDRTGRLRLAAPRIAPLLEQQENTTAARVRGHLPELPVAMRVVLARLPMGMSEVGRLTPETVLPLPDGCLGHVRLETRAGRLIQEVRLGQLDGKKAVRLSEDAEVPQPSLPAAGKELPSGPELEGLPEPPAVDAGQPQTAPAGESSLPDLPDLLPLPEAGGGDLPDLPDLPELPNLPELPDLP